MTKIYELLMGQIPLWSNTLTDAFPEDLTLDDLLLLNDAKQKIIWKTADNGHKIPFDENGNALSEFGKVYTHISTQKFPLKKGQGIGYAAFEGAHFKFSPTEGFVFKKYTEDGHAGANARINNACRKKEIDKLSREDSQRLVWMDQAFTKARTTRPIRVFRGQAEKYALDAIHKGQFSESGFCSTTVSPSRAKSYAGKGKKYIFVLDVPEGYPAISLQHKTKTPEDREILLRRGTKGRITDTFEEDGVTFVRVAVGRKS
jgi:hypothetical protein